MFNLWKSIKNSLGFSKNASREQLLEEYRSDQSLKSLEGETITSALDKERKDLKDESIAYQLDQSRDDTPDSTVESRLASKSSEDRGLVSRQDKESLPISDINLVSEAWDSKYREAYEKASKSSRDLFSLHFKVGDPRVDTVSPDDSLIQNRPGRLQNIGGLPDGDEAKALANIGKQPTVKEAKQKILEVDRRVFEIKVAAAMEERQFNEYELEELSYLKNKKRSLIMEIISE